MSNHRASRPSKSRSRGWAVSAFALALVAPALAVGGAGAALAESDDYVVAKLSADPEDLVDKNGKAVSLISAESAAEDSAEQVSLVRTAGGVDARVTAQWSQPRTASPLPEPGNYPMAVGEKEEISPQGIASVQSGFNFEDIKQLTRDDLELAFVSAVTSSSVSFAWRVNPLVSEYVVTRDGAEVARTGDGSFLDRGLSAGKSYLYEIRAEVPATEAREATYTSRTVPLTTLGSESASSLGGGVISPLTWQLYTTAFTYKTFITDSYVPVDFATAAGCFVNGAVVGDYFGGDGRYFAGPGLTAPYTTPSYRTQAFVNVNWDNPSPWDIVTVKLVSPTRLYDSSLALKATHTASTNGIVFQNPSRAGDYVSLGISHEVGNPFCVVSAIRYSLAWVEFHRSGTVSFEGSRQPVPAHEAYARFSDSSGNEFWYSLYLGNQGSFLCTLPSLCVSENIDGSWSY